MTLEYVTNLIDKKIEDNPEFIKFTFFELRVKEELNETDMLAVLSLSAQRLSNLGYSIYRKGQKYYYNGEVGKVEDELIAIKKRGEVSVRKTL